MKHIYTICAIALLASCANIQQEGAIEYDKGFKDTRCISADSAAMTVIIKPGNIYWSDPYIIVSNTATSCDRHFAVFNQQLEYLYSFCENGQGPQECIMPTVVKGMPAGRFLVRDHATEKYHSFELTDSCAVADRIFTIDGTAPGESAWEINHIHDNIYLAKGVAARKTTRRLIDFSTGISIDSLPQTFDLAKSMGNAYFSEFDDCWIVSSRDRFACAYFFINRIEFGEISDSDRLKLTTFVGAENAPRFHEYTDEKLTGKYEYNVDYNIVYYEWMFSDRLVYASYFGKPWGEIDTHSTTIESYTFAGTPQTLYKLDVPLASFIVLERSNRIIGLNTGRSEDFYIYDIQ